MDKQRLFKELKEVGIKVKSLDFSVAGYSLRLSLNVNKGFGWEELEQTPFDGLEVVRIRQSGEGERDVMFIPAIEREFKDYIRRHKQNYDMKIDIILEDLQCIVEHFGSFNANSNFTNFKNKYYPEIEYSDNIF